MSSKSEVFEFSRGQNPPIKGGYMWPVMPIFELGLAIPIKSHVWKFGSDWLSLSRVIIWIFRGGRNPLLRGLQVTCNAHFWAWLSYSSQKSSVKIWFGLVEPFKSYRVHKHFSMGQTPPIREITFELWCPFLNSDELFQSKFMCGNLVWIGWNRRHVNFEGGRRPPVRRGYMWPAMPIFELGRGCLDKSHVWKFGSNWLRLSRVIVRKNQMTRGQERRRVRGQRTKIFKVRCRSSPYRWA